MPASASSSSSSFGVVGRAHLDDRRARRTDVRLRAPAADLDPLDLAEAPNLLNGLAGLACETGLQGR
jgi:hypothetical protein